METPHPGSNGAKSYLRSDFLRTKERSQPSLTAREREVLTWVAKGKRNREIGAILQISPRTVEKHIAQILEKLGVETRGAAAAWWYEGRT